ncbi:hypothetical protein HY768_02825 [candidate division TA06 bacterium]|uniref:PorV/PorQ family protein n=1 Tax=candidate division TA06 bacterium TaxID=2250710 RepID=A0A933MJN4_UNCT6|nr:hypothetical protein [candidate division TA06 bacterium]
MRKITIILFVVVACQTFSYAVFEDWQTGSRANGMAGAYTGMAYGLDAIRWNPAGLTGLEGWQAQANVESQSGGAGWMNETVSLGKNMGRWGGMALAGQKAGCDWESGQSLTFSNGFSMTDQFSFGYNLNLYRLWQNRLGSAITGGVDVGLLAQVHRKWRIGCFGRNLNHPTLGVETQYELPSSISIGLAYEPLSGLVGSVEASKEPGHTVCYKVGTEFAIKPNVFNLRGGLSSQGREARYSLGTDITAFGLTAGYAYEGEHQPLPGNHQIGLAYKCGPK